MDSLLIDRPAAARPGSLSSPAVPAGPPALYAERIQVEAGAFSFAAREVAFRSGVATAIIGPNGAGKSTLLEALLGLRRARVDHARILGVPAARFLRDAAQARRLGVQLQRVEYPDGARVREILDLHRALYRRQDAGVATALAIGELADRPYAGLSKGQRQRLDLFIALAHCPELAVLDEPFTGLDRSASRSVLALLHRHLAGLTVAMICHAAEELDAVEDLIWVRDGGIRYHGPKAGLKHAMVGDFRARLRLDDPVRLRQVQQALTSDPRIRRVVRPTPGEILVFGAAGLDRRIHGLVGDGPIRLFEFAASDDGDLLRACTRGEDDA